MSPPLRLSSQYRIAESGPTDWVLNGKMYRLIKMLKVDTWAAVSLVERDEKRYAFKVSRLRGRLERLASPLMNFISRREYRLYHACNGIDGVPPLTERVGKNAYLHEFVEGVTLDVNDDVGEAFFDELGRIVHDIHARGVAYVDLAKRENIIVGADGRPHLIDFQISMMLSRRRNPLAWLHNRLVRWLQHEDLYHLHKHRDRILSRGDPHYVLQYNRRRSLFTRVRQLLIRRPYHFIKRLFVAKHHDTTFFR